MRYMDRFDGKGELYAKARPNYTAALFEYLKADPVLPAGSVFADVGAGTGIFSAQLLDCGYKVFAVEPNADMRRKAEEALSQREGFTSVDGDDAAMGLPDRSVDVVTAAQAFHWFDAAAFQRECRRVLKPGGKVILVYNSRDKAAPCTRALAELYRRYNPEFHEFSNGMTHEKCLVFYKDGCEVFRADNTQTYDRQGWLDRTLSSSYSLKEGDAGFTEYRQEIDRLFDRYSADGRIAVPTETVAYIGSV